MSGPLRGLIVLEIAGIGPGPFACMMLADMGARVIRVDRPVGSDGAGAGLVGNDGVVDRGRESIALNLKDPRGVEAVLELAARADVLVEGFRPGVMERLGLGPDACMTRNPKLVYGRITGWGQHGPLSQAAGHDLNYIAISGALHPIGPADRPPAIPLNLVGDYGGGGMLVALGVLAALLEARQSGRGQVVDAAMSDGSATLMATLYGWLANGFWGPGRESNFLDGAAPFYSTYACADGKYIAVGAIEPQFYRELLQRCGIDEATMQPQWHKASWPAGKARLATLFASRTRDDWTRLLEGTDACFAPVLSMAEAAAHPHNAARATFVAPGGVVQPAPAPRFDRTASVLPPAAPRTGEHTARLLAELGYDEAAQAELQRAGVAQVAPLAPDRSPAARPDRRD